MNLNKNSQYQHSNTKIVLATPVIIKGGPLELELELSEINDKKMKLPIDQLKLIVENLEDGSSEPKYPSDSRLSIMKRIILKRLSRILFFFTSIVFLILSRRLIPERSFPCVQDKIIDMLEPINIFINTRDNENYRSLLQGLCSFIVDTTFLTTFGYWIIYGKNFRLPLALGLFYGCRAIVQNLWYSPFPDGFYWSSPGFPSLVVPYGRGSDFFFSGHSGFLTICANEWHINKKSRARNLVLIGALYTIFILMSYRIHYSIDIFVGLFFSDWCFWKVDMNEKQVFDLLISNYKKLFKQNVENKEEDLKPAVQEI